MFRGRWENFYVRFYNTNLDAGQSSVSMLNDVKKIEKVFRQGQKWQARNRSNRKGQLPKLLLCVSIQLRT